MARAGYTGRSDYACGTRLVKGVALRARIYDSIRTAHLERLLKSARAVTVHRSINYDYDPKLAARCGIVQMSRFAIFRWILRNRPRIIETNEPLQINAWPTLVAIHVARLLIPRQHRPKIVFYAIENADIVSSVADRLRVPIFVSAMLVRSFGGWFLRASERICFGTSAAEQNYRHTLGALPVHAEIATIEALPCAAPLLSVKEENLVLFLGAFEERKGLLKTLAALDDLAMRRESLSFLVVGKGPLQSVVAEFAEARDWVTAIFDPPRAEVFGALKRASTLVLFSQPTPRWREQVGLPILEALAHGVDVVASAETGLASWLVANGHTVLSPDASSQELSAAVGRSLHNSRPALAVTAALPLRDTRLLADDWMFE